jgi:subtilisin family serine protease
VSEESASHRRFIGDSSRPTTEERDAGGEGESEPLALIVELNVRYPGGLVAATSVFFDEVWRNYPLWAGHSPPPSPTLEEGVPTGLARVSAKLYQCFLTRLECRAMLAWDQQRAGADPDRQVIFKVWPDYTLYPQIDRSAPTVKADAAWRSYDARGVGIVWAVVDSGIDSGHPHFSALELAAIGSAPSRPAGRTDDLHRDFSSLVRLRADPGPPQPLQDEQGHGTHVAGIIAGEVPAGRTPHVALSDEPPAGAGYVQRPRVGNLRGMAPACELVSLKVLRKDSDGSWITSSAAVIAALEYLRTEVNVDRTLPRVHGVNISLACPWDPAHYAAGRSPLCQVVNQLVDSGVVVVVAAGNFGATSAGTSATAATGSIAEPAHAEAAIAVGSTHRDAPHAFGVTWTSGRGPTLDGRTKPDVVAPGEWITSAAAGAVRSRAGLADLAGTDPLLTYAEQSGTSMAAPHVSGIIAAFLSARPEFIGRPREVARLLIRSATDLGREKYAQGAGLVDLMRMLASV